MKLAKKLGGLVRVLNSLTVGIIIQSKEENILYANNVALRLFYSDTREDLKQKIKGNYHKHFSFSDVNGIIVPHRHLPISLTLITKKPQRRLVNFKYNIKGDSHWLRFESLPILDGRRELIAVISVFQDYTDIKRSHDSFKITNEIINEISSATSLRKRLTNFSNLVVPLFADWCFVHIIKKDGMSEVIESHSDVIDTKIKGVLLDNLQSEFYLKSEKVMITGKEILLENFDISELKIQKYEQFQPLKDLKSVNLMMTPLKARGKVLGVVSFIRYIVEGNKGSFDPSFLRALSKQVSVLIDNAKLYEETKKSLLKERELTRNLSESRQTLNLALEAGKMTIWEWEIKTNRFIWLQQNGDKENPEKSFRGSREDFLKLIYSEDRTKFSNALITSLQELKDISVIFRLSHKKHLLRWYRLEGTLLLDGKAKPERFVGVITDITRQKRTNDKLRESEKKFRLAVNASMDSIILYDNRTNEIVDVNKSSGSLFDKTRGWLITANLRNLFSSLPLKDRGETTTKGRVKTLEYTQSFNFLKNMNLLFIRDISDRKIEEKRREHFLGVVSHELKNSLTAINVNTDVLRRLHQNSGNKRISRNLEMIDDGSRILNRLINDLLDVTRIRQNKLIFSYEFFDFDGLVSDIIRVKRQENSHQIFYQSAGVTEILADKNRIIQVIINIIDNAIKYSPRASKVDVISKNASNYVSLTVKDYGIGISVKDRKRIFELYTRGKVEGEFEGLGIGLYISSEIIKRHGGKFYVSSKKGEGSEFTFRLPKKPKVVSGSQTGKKKTNLL